MIKRTLMTSSILMALAICFGAFGAHALKESLTALQLETYQTGVQYHLIHAIALFGIGILELIQPQLKLTFVKISLLAGIYLFSFNCYFYAITSQKIFAMLVPLGGTLFIISWLKLAWSLKGLKHLGD